MANVLILTNSQDGAHTDAVVQEVVARGSSVVRLDSDLVTNGSQQLVLHGSSELELSTSEGHYDLSVVDSVWLRRPKVFDFAVKNPKQKVHTENEFRAFLAGIYAILEEKTWLNTPQAMERAKLKIFQLKLARELGMLVPETLVTANPETARKFCLKGKTVFKPITESNLQDEHKTLLIPTTVISDQHIDNLNLIRNQYVLLQRLIEKEYELRITYVGGKLFVAKQSPAGDASSLPADWRLLQVNGKSEYIPWEIPLDLERKICNMMKELNLDFATLDFAVDHEGDHYFLEVNPNGQWFGYCDAIGMPASAEIAKLLTSLERR